MLDVEPTGRKLAYLSDAAIPSREANSIQTMKMCEAFAKQGFEVALFVPDRGENLGDPYEFYGVEECFQIARVPWKPGERYLFSLLVPIYVRRFGPEIVFGRFIPACFFTSVFGYRVVIESHFPVSKNKRIITWMFRILLLFDRIEQLIVISGTLRRYYLDSYDRLTDDMVSVAHDAASDISNSDSMSLADSDRMQVGYVGHLYEGKGMSLIAELANECSWADFHIVGGTNEDIEYWESELEECPNVEFHGFVPPQDVRKYHRSMDVLLAPYQQEVFGNNGEIDISRWMSPLKIFEYMAVGGAIVASDLPVLREVLNHGENALLCDPNDFEDWMNTLESLDDDTIAKIGNSARQSFEKNYTYRQRARILGHKF